MSSLFFMPKTFRQQSDGTAYPGAKINFYLTGTTTPTNTYQDNARTTPHTNPVVADSEGIFAPIYLDPDITYRAVITESDDTGIDDVDPIASPITAAGISVLDTATYFAATNVETILAEIGNLYSQKAAAETITGVKTHSATVNMADNVVSRPVLKDFGCTHTAPTATDTVEFDLVNGNSFKTTLTANLTVTLSNPPASGTYGQCVVQIVQAATGGPYTVTWPASVMWPGGAAPTMSTGASAKDLYTFVTVDGGTSWFGNFAKAYS